MFSRIVSVLLSYVDSGSFQAFPSQKRLAQHVGCSEKTIKRNLAAARNLGLLTIESVSGEELRRRVGSKKRLPPHHRFTIYTIHIEHWLWKADEDAIREARLTIKESTYKGVDQRCDIRSKCHTVATLPDGCVPLNPDVSVLQTEVVPVPEVDDGPYRGDIHLRT
jgi:hypothetical protein